MNLRAALLLLAALAACKGGVARGGAGVGDACAADADCANPLTCVSEKCALPGSLQACVPNARRCQGSDVVECDSAGLRETLAEACPSSCRAGQCVADACTAGDRRCGTAGVEQCVPGASGVSWTLAQACPSGCDPATTTCKSLVCKPLDTRCSPDLSVCSADGSQWIAQPCPAGAACSGGQCVAQKCAPNSLFCDGNVLVQCDGTGSGFAQQTACPGTCSAGACVTGVCAAGATRCSADGSAVEACKPDGSGWALSQQCAAGGCTALASDRAACAAQVCSPLTRRCTAAADGVMVCAGDGSGWSLSQTCSDGCSAGACLPPPAGCIAGSLRCAGIALEKCDGTNWNEIAECLGGCSQGACSGGSCAPGFTLAVTSPSPAPADGVSTLLATTGPILDASGAPVPDGTLIALSAGAGAQIVAPLAQVRTSSGRADFAVRAPTAAANVTISATVAGSAACVATAQVAFVTAAAAAYASEDFTTDAERDYTATTAQWQTGAGRAMASFSELGDGRDGAFAVPAGVWDLTTSVPSGRTAPFAPVLRVTAVGAQSVSVTGAYADSFQPGDEALLLELQGAGTAAVVAAGAWELLTVAQSSGGQVSFTAPVLGVYGQKPGAPLAGEKVVLQRVPHFTNLTVSAGASLTASAWDGSKGGVVVMRVAGTAGVGGAIHADQLGFRGGDSPDAVHDQPGESFGGVAALYSGPAALFGGGSGGYLCGDPWHLSQLDSWYGSGGSYGGAGSSTCSAAGGTYGAPSLSRLFFGSASGSQEQNTDKPCAQTSDCPSESYSKYNTSAYGLVSGACGAYAAAGNAFGRCQGTLTRAAQARPCGSDRTCQFNTTFNVCPGTAADVGGGVGTVGISDGTSCFNSCPGLQGSHSAGTVDGCTSCGCSTWGYHDCYHDECYGNPSHCGQSVIRWDYDYCASTCSLGFSCPHSYDTCNSFGCGFLSLGSPCYQPVYTCWHGPGGAGGGQDCDYSGGSGCNSCSTCPVDEYTNASAVHCAENPGCCTNPGCEVCGACAAGDTSCDFSHGTVKCPNPWQGHAAGGRGGGMVLLFAGTLDLSGGGRVSANGGLPASGNFGGAGGSLFLRLGNLKLAASGTQISAAGAAGGGAGRIRLERAAGDDPVARGQISPAPYTTAFALPQAQSRALPLPAGKKATSATLVAALDAGTPPGAPAAAESYFVSADGGQTWLALSPNAKVTFAATSDLRWRAQLSPQLGVPASVSALSLLIQVQ